MTPSPQKSALIPFAESVATRLSRTFKMKSWLLIVSALILLLLLAGIVFMSFLKRFDIAVPVSVEGTELIPGGGSRITVAVDAKFNADFGGLLKDVKYLRIDGREFSVKNAAFLNKESAVSMQVVIDGQPAIHDQKAFLVTRDRRLWQLLMERL